MSRFKFDLQLFGEDEDYIADKFKELYAEFENLDYESAAELIKMAQMERIADSLELIRQSLEVLEPLADCVRDTSGYGGRLYVAGDITTYEP